MTKRALTWSGVALAAIAGLAFAGNAGLAPAETRAASPEDAEAEALSAAPQTASEPPKTLSFSGELTQGGFVRGQAPSAAIGATLGDQALTLGEDGSFFAAFDRDSPGTLDLKVTLPDGEVQSEALSISPRQWKISRVNIARRKGGSSEAWWKKRKPEWEAIVAARAKETGAAGWRQDFIWPVKGRISGLFGRQRIYRGEPGSYHSGIDIAPGHGVPYVAPADGVVVLARMGFSLEGGLIIIDHGGGLNSAFLHSSKILVKEGEAVTQGQRIGHVGSTGRSTGPHLHWSLKWNDARLDPLLFTGPMK